MQYFRDQWSKDTESLLQRTSCIDFLLVVRERSAVVPYLPELAAAASHMGVEVKVYETRTGLTEDAPAAETQIPIIVGCPSLL